MARQAPHSTVRVATRLAIGFALDLVKLGGFGRDVVDVVILAAISQANVAQITRTPELQWAYATLDRPLPDELRRPVSVSAIANSLRLPFETVRRRIAALVAQGILTRSPRGVIIPTAPTNSPGYRALARGHYELVRKLYLRLRAIGMMENLARQQHPGFDAAHPPVRLVMRLATDYLLRIAEPFSLQIDLVTGLILMDLVHANTEHWADTDSGIEDRDWAPNHFGPDRLRRPVRAAALSERLGIPQETVRRHLTRLLEKDRCERTAEGYLVPARLLGSGPYLQFMVDNQSHLHRLFAGLSEFGLIFEWEREILALRGAA